MAFCIGCVRDVRPAAHEWLGVSRMRSTRKSWRWAGGGPGTGRVFASGAWHSPTARAVPDTKHSPMLSFPRHRAFQIWSFVSGLPPVMVGRLSAVVYACFFYDTKKDFCNSVDCFSFCSVLLASSRLFAFLL